MRNNYATSAIAAAGSFSLTNDPRKGSSTLVYEIENTVTSEHSVFVDYFVNDQWSYACISLLDLKKFVIESGMNEFCIDSMYCGEHCQDAGSFDAETYVTENLYDVLMAYFKDGKGLAS